jgi:hypothetical protein
LKATQKNECRKNIRGLDWFPNHVEALANAHQEIVWLNITM